MIYRLVILSLILFVGICVSLHLTTHYSEASAAKIKKLKKKGKKYKKFSKKWWHAYRHRLGKNKSLEARKRSMQLRRIRLANAEKSRLAKNNQNSVYSAPSILVNDLFIIVEGKINDVFDGETFNIKSKDGKFYWVRMMGIDAPEMNQGFGNLSHKKLSDLILGKEATVVIRKRDLTGRYIGTVYSGGEDVNLLLIETGMAVYFRQNGYEPVGVDRQLYERAEQKARANGKGLWNNQKSGNALALKR